MANLERPAEAGGTGRMPETPAAVQNHSVGAEVDSAPADAYPIITSHYTLRATGGSMPVSTDTVGVRAINNFVKSCMLDATVRCVAVAAASGACISVADIGCGRGQDFPKWMHAVKATGATLGTFYAMDAADTRTHLHDMAQKYLAPVTETIVTRMGDMSKQFTDCPDDSMDVVSAQLCLHYLCDDVKRLEAFFVECARVLKRTGVLLVSFADGRAVVRRGRDALTAAPRPGYTVQVRGKHYVIDIPSVHLRAHTASPWGCRYTFSLADSVVTVPEFLCHEGSVCAVAQRVAGFVAGPSMCFDEAAASFLAAPHSYYKDIAVKMRCIDVEDKKHVFDTASLYRMAVFSRSTTSLQRWQAALSAGGGGFHGECGMTSTPRPSNPAPPPDPRCRGVHKKQKL